MKFTAGLSRLSRPMSGLCPGAGAQPEISVPNFPASPRLASHRAASLGLISAKISLSITSAPTARNKIARGGVRSAEPLVSGKLGVEP